MFLRGKCNGAKPATDATDDAARKRKAFVVGERSASVEAVPEGMVERAEVRMSG